MGPFRKRDDRLGEGGRVGGLAGESGDGIASALAELALEPGLAAVQENAELAAVEEEIADQLVPGVEIHLLGDDAEIEADIDQEGADVAAADLGGDLFWRGQEEEGGIVVRSAAVRGRFGGARSAGGGGTEACWLEVPAAGAVAEQPFFERGGAQQAAGDAGEDQGDIAGGEDAGDEGEEGEDIRACGVLLESVGEVFTVGDERSDEAEDLADAGGHGGVGGFGRGGECVGHKWNKTTS